MSRANNCILKKDKVCQEDEVLDNQLRPKTWDEYIGQEKLKKNLQIMIEAAKQRGETPDHILLYGNPGLGKTTVSHLIAREMNVEIKTTSGPAVEKAGDLASILTNLNPGDVLFIDEIHRLNKICEEVFYPALEDFKLNLVLGKGPMARTMEMSLPRFTLVGATTRLALLSSPLRNRFGATFQVGFYKNEDIEKIILHSSQILNVAIEPQAVEIIARSSRYTPRVANRLLKRIRDFAQVEADGKITAKTARAALEFLEIDEKGLEPGDRKIIETIIDKFSGGPVGLKTLAAATSEEEDAILDIYEPYLMQLGFIERTSKGRVATKVAYQHLGLKYQGEQNLL